MVHAFASPSVSAPILQDQCSSAACLVITCFDATTWTVTNLYVECDLTYLAGETYEHAGVSKNYGAIVLITLTLSVHNIDGVRYLSQAECPPVDVHSQHCFKILEGPR